ncbi:MAG: hypothetical protein FJ255_05210 [Phycisphaerae bacterium]|nr:hypothetical protein [Phycisphaerae bacterium]
MWSAADLYVPPPAELERMRAAVARHPQHPETGLLKVFEDRAASPPRWVEHELWAGFDGMRVNTTLPETPNGFHDMAVAGATAWSLAPGSAILNTSTTRRAEIDFATSGRSVATTGLSHLTGGLANARSEFGVGEPIPALMGGSEWRGSRTGKTRSGRNVGVTAAGRWNEADGWGTVDHVTVSIERDGVQTVIRYASSDWNPVPGMGIGAAATVTRTTGGRPDWTLRLARVEPVDRAAVHRVLAEPTVARADPIRGAATINEVVDYRGNGPVVTRRTPSGTVETLASGDLPAQRRVRSLDRLGWIVLAAVIGTAALLWIRSFRRKRAGIPRRPLIGGSR